MGRHPRTAHQKMLAYIFVLTFAIQKSIQASLTWPPVCYEYDGTTSTDFACNPMAAVSACCSAGWECASNLYCQQDGGIFQIGTCTQQIWSDPACPFALSRSSHSTANGKEQALIGSLQISPSMRPTPSITPSIPLAVMTAAFALSQIIKHAATKLKGLKRSSLMIPTFYPAAAQIWPHTTPQPVSPSLHQHFPLAQLHEPLSLQQTEQQ